MGFPELEVTQAMQPNKATLFLEPNSLNFIIIDNQLPSQKVKNLSTQIPPTHPDEAQIDSGRWTPSPPCIVQDHKGNKKDKDTVLRESFAPHTLMNK